MRKLFFCIMLFFPLLLVAEVGKEFLADFCFEENVGQVVLRTGHTDYLQIRDTREFSTKTNPEILFILKGADLIYYFSDRGYSIVQHDSLGNSNRTDFYFENDYHAQPEGLILKNENSRYYFPSGEMMARKFQKIIYHNVFDGNDLEFSCVDGFVEKKLIRIQSSFPKKVSFEVIGSDVNRLSDGNGNFFSSSIGNYEEVVVKNNGYFISCPKPNRICSILQTSDYFLREADGNNQTQISSITWLTYLGGNSAEDLFGVAVTSDKGAVVTGRTGSLNFPTTPGAMQDTLTLSYDAIITRFDSAGNCLWSTYYGGTNFDGGSQVVMLDSTFIIAGMTSSSDLPMLFPTQAVNNGSYDAFLLVLDSAGQMIRSTYYGGSGGDQGLCIALGPANEIVLGGSSTSTDLPFASSGFQGTMGGQIDAFLTVFDASLNLQWSTYYGGNSPEDIHALCVSPQGEISFVGGTRSFNFPITANAWQSGLLNQPDNYLVKFGMDGARHYATFFGGTNNEDANGVVADELGNVYMTGFTFSADFPTQGAVYQSNLMGQQDVFVSKFDSTGQLIWSTYVGGGGKDVAWGISRLGKYIFICGETESPTFPVSANAIQPVYAIGGDGFVIKMDTSGQMVSGTFLGGNGADALLAITVDADTNVISCGDTYSTNLPIANAFQNTNGANGDGYVVKFGMAEEIPLIVFVPTENDSILIFPNPSNGIITIQNQERTILEIEVVDALGRTVKSMNENANIFSIDISDLANGIYLLKMIDENAEVHILQFVRN